MEQLITINDLCGNLAKWVVQQHPYGTATLVDSANEKLRESAKEWGWDDVGGLLMRKYTYKELEGFLHHVLYKSKEAKVWNTPKSRHSNGYVFSSRYDGPKAEDDFIDVDALLRNVALHTIRESALSEARPWAPELMSQPPVNKNGE
jgi:hypothetical protein